MLRRFLFAIVETPFDRRTTRRFGAALLTVRRLTVRLFGALRLTVRFFEVVLALRRLRRGLMSRISFILLSLLS